MQSEASPTWKPSLLFPLQALSGSRRQWGRGWQRFNRPIPGLNSLFLHFQHVLCVPLLSQTVLTLPLSPALAPSSQAEPNHINCCPSLPDQFLAPLHPPHIHQGPNREQVTVMSGSNHSSSFRTSSPKGKSQYYYLRNPYTFLLKVT